LLLVPKEVLVMGILAYPLVDTLRVFVLRAVRGISPFHPDRNHLHHRLMMRYRTHRKTVFVVYGYSIFMIALAFSTSFFGKALPVEILFGGMLVIAFGVFYPTLRRTKMDYQRSLSDKTIPEKSQKKQSAKDSDLKREALA